VKRLPNYHSLVFSLMSTITSQANGATLFPRTHRMIHKQSWQIQLPGSTLWPIIAPNSQDTVAPKKAGAESGQFKPLDIYDLVLTSYHAPNKPKPRRLQCRWPDDWEQLHGSHETRSFGVPHLGHEVVHSTWHRLSDTNAPTRGKMVWFNCMRDISMWHCMIQF
jgi:hypothetical protein